MDRLILDFETDKITIETDNQQGTEYCPGLVEKKKDIYKLLGYEETNVKPFVDAVNDLLNGKITPEELIEFGKKWAEE